MRHVPRRRSLADADSRRAAGLAAVAFAVWLLPGAVGAAWQPPDARPRVVVAEYDGIIHPIAAEFVDDVIGRAEGVGAVAVVLVLRTPGGLVDSTRAIISRMIASHAPVVVFISP